MAEADTEFAAAGERLKALRERSERLRESRADTSLTVAPTPRSWPSLHALARADHLRTVPIPPLPRSAVKLRELFDRLAPVIGLSPKLIDERVIAGITQFPYAPVTIKTDAGRSALTVLAERQNDFPGVKQEQVAISAYPFGELASQTLGHVGQVNEEEHKLPASRAFRGIRSSASRVWSTTTTAICAARRESGACRLTPKANPRRQSSKRRPPRPAMISSSRSISALERVGERALRYGVVAGPGQRKPRLGAAFVAINPLNGEIYATASYPGYDPNRFAKPMTQPEYDRSAAAAKTKALILPRRCSTAPWKAPIRPA